MVNNTSDMEEMDALLSKYFSGEATPEEAMIIDDWRKENAAEFIALWNAWEATSIKPYKQPDVPAAWREVVLPRSKSISFYTWIAAAGVLICIAVAAALFFEKRDITTVASATKKIILPDSSIAILNSGSSLTYDPSFKERNVSLKGEAYFDVRQVAARPFTVKAGLANIKVLGTSFTVADTGAIISVRVYSGKVMMYTDKENLIISAAQTGAFGKGNEHFSLTPFVFHFEDEDLQRVTATLAAAYHKKIFFKDPEIASLRISSNFENKSLDYILQIIASTLDVNYTYSNQDEIYFEKN